MVSTTSEPDVLREVLSEAHGRVGRVEKQRVVYLIGRTRVHIDHVKDLGEFLELEVVLDDGDSLEEGMKEAHVLIEKFGIKPDQLVEGAYLDLLKNK